MADPIAGATPEGAILATSRDDAAVAVFCSPCRHGGARIEFRSADKNPGIDAIRGVSTASVSGAAPVAHRCGGTVIAAVLRTTTHLPEPGEGA